MFSWQDPRLTLKALIATVLTFVSALIVGDALFLMLAVNLWLLAPLIAKKKPQEIQKVQSLINANIDMIVKKVPFISRIEQ